MLDDIGKVVHIIFEVVSTIAIVIALLRRDIND
jgi:hypothetical protein